DANDFQGLKAPRTPAFNQPDVATKPAWLRGFPLLGPANIALIDQAFRMRAQSVESVDDLIARLEERLAADGIAQNTYVIFSSDNGYHMGEFRLMPGKMTAYDVDVRVPLVVTGPGVAAGRTVPDVTENVDLNPTFVEVARGAASEAVDGQSLLPFLGGSAVAGWPEAALVE